MKGFIEVFDTVQRQPLLIRISSITSIMGNGIKTLGDNTHFVAETYDEIKKLMEEEEE